MTGAPLAALRMYDLPEVRAATDELWRAIAARLPDAPPALSWDGDERAQWRDRHLVLGQACGWPLVAGLSDVATVVGAFRYRLEYAEAAATYRSVIVAAEDRPLSSFAGEVAAVNSWDSLSGWVSLAVAVAETRDASTDDASFFASVVETGGHIASIDAVRAGRAAVASIDAVTYFLLGRHRAAAVADLAVVGRGPSVPTLPLITAATDPAPIRAAVGAAVADPATAGCRDRLLIDGFDRLDASAYTAVTSLGAAARAVIPTPSLD